MKLNTDYTEDVKELKELLVKLNEFNNTDEVKLNVTFLKVIVRGLIKIMD